MKLYNTLTRKIENFIPWEKGVVKMYTCGPTVYSYAHIGNLRTYIMEDILEKTLRFIGFDVTRVMNITDVGHLTSDADTGDDKMVKSAKKENKTVLDIAKFYTEAFFKDTEKLNIKKPDIVSPATKNIDEYIKIITKLLDTGYAYKEIDRSIFMNPDKKNSRIIIPIASYNDIMKGYPVDFFFYANNYDKAEDNELEFFSNPEEAIEIFKAGKRMAKGTTSEVGIVDSYFANPFGPVQKQKETDILIDRFFKEMFAKGVKIGQIKTQLGIKGMEKAGPMKAAQKLFELIKD